MKTLSLLAALTLALQAFAGPKTKTAARKPQQASRYYNCVFQKKTGEKLFEFAARVPEQEKSLQYEESDRVTVLKVGIHREGWVTVDYVDNIASKTIGKARARTDFNGPIAVNVEAGEGFTLDCR